MKTYLFVIKSIILLFFVSSCSDDSHSPLEKDGTAPANVSSPVIRNIPGGAFISYTLPTDKDLLYVLARHTDKNGKTRDFKSSYYTNSVIVEGFGDTEERTIELYAVDRSENKSNPVKVTVQPLTPPVIETGLSLTIKPDFGGLSFTYLNDFGANLAIMVCTKNTEGEMYLAETFYTALKSGKFALRGFESELRLFGVVVRDKWGNLSDTLFQELVPVYEKLLDKSKFKAVTLPTDALATAWSGALEYMWNGVSSDDKAAHTGNVSTSIPKYITFDLGVTAQLSRFNLHTITDDKHMYNDVSPRIYEVWGCQNPDPSGSFDGWTKLVTVENIKPSGLPIGVLTEDDRRVARIGDEADIPSEMPKVRYIRIRCLKNWAGNTNMIINEVTFWGNDK